MSKLSVMFKRLNDDTNSEYMYLSKNMKVHKLEAIDYLLKVLDPLKRIRIATIQRALSDKYNVKSPKIDSVE